MTATATITATQLSDVLLVPNTALRFSPTATEDQSAKKTVAVNLLPSMPRSNTRKSAAASASTAAAKQVWILPQDGGGKSMAVAVTPGISDGHMTEIIGGDLKVGMLVITDQKVSAK
jgi:HlyD family secretion protein